jgi:hypothetical protein
MESQIFNAKDAKGARDAKDCKMYIVDCKMINKRTTKDI